LQPFSGETFVNVIKRTCIAAYLLLGLLGHSVLAQPAAKASTTPVATLAELIKRPNLAGLAISPNGRYLAATAPIKGRMNLIVIDLQTRQAAPLTSYDAFDVGRPRWVGDDKLLYQLVELNAPTGQINQGAGGLFVINRDGTQPRRLSTPVKEMINSGQVVFRTLSFFSRIPGNDKEIIAMGNMTSADSTDLYRLNLSNGRYTLITNGRPAQYTTDWILDSQLVARVVTARVKDKNEFVVYYRGFAQAPWAELYRFSETQAPAFVPLILEPDDKTLQVAFNGGRDTMAVFQFNPETKQFGSLIASHPRYDMGASPMGELLGGPIYDRLTNKLLGYTVDADKPQVVWLDETYARLQRTFDTALPDRTNTFLRTPDGKRFLVTSYSDVAPTRWYFFDEEKRSLEELGASRPWLDSKLQPVNHFILKARDGLEIPSYYVLPRGAKLGDKLPTVVHIHGGPFARDVQRGGAFDASFGVVEAQILASRGYAVILPNFRVTPEMGNKVYYAGFGSYGRAMSDDHEDAVKWAVGQGIADPNRVCISGASYGGYASLHAATRPTNPFKCVISGLPVTDLKFQNEEADYARSESAVDYWKAVMGVKSLDDPLLRELSPVFNAAKIKVPVFMYVGSDDTRTPPRQAERMAKALAESGNPVKTYFVGQGEGHGFGVEQNQIDLYTKMLEFLDSTIGKK
jgi:dipeptidyl aminopeptidase/acylaminoacyl peptidase